MPYYLPRFGAYFVHVPRTAGHWMLEVFRRANIHATMLPSAYGIDTVHGPPYWWIGPERYERTFAFVRHPFHWLKSYWRLQKGHWPLMATRKNWTPLSLLDGLGDDNFQDFLFNVERSQPAFVTRLYESMVGQEGCPLVGHIGHYENLITETSQIFAKLGIPLDEDFLKSVPAQHVSGGDKMKDLFVPDSETWTFVANREMGAIKRWY